MELRNTIPLTRNSIDIPAIHKNELYRIGVHFPLERLWKPFIHFEILKEIFVDSFDKVVSAYFEEKEEGIYLFKEAFSTQRKLVDYFDRQEKNTYNRWLLQSLMELLANVILLPVENEEEAFHFRFNMQHTSSFQYLNNEVKTLLKISLPHLVSISEIRQDNLLLYPSTHQQLQQKPLQNQMAVL